MVHIGIMAETSPSLPDFIRRVTNCKNFSSQRQEMIPSFIQILRTLKLCVKKVSQSSSVLSRVVGGVVSWWNSRIVFDCVDGFVKNGTKAVTRAVTGFDDSWSVKLCFVRKDFSLVCWWKTDLGFQSSKHFWVSKFLHEVYKVPDFRESVRNLTPFLAEAVNCNLRTSKIL